MKTTVLIAIKGFAVENNINHKLLLAILDNESNGKGFNEDGKIKTRYESHIHDEFILVYDGRHPNHVFLPKFDTAWVRRHSLEDLKLLSTSFGIAQIMGYHYESMSYTSPNDMIKEWRSCELVQVMDFLVFCTKFRGGKFMKALKNGDTKTVARYYNGAYYKKNKYKEKLDKFIV